MLRSHPIVSVPLFLGLVLLASQTLAADFTGRVVGVSDSDTITVLHSGKAEPEQYDHPNLPLMREPTWIERFGRWFKEKIHLRAQEKKGVRKERGRESFLHAALMYKSGMPR